MGKATTVDPESNTLFRGLDRLPPALWEDLERLRVTDVCGRAGVRHEPGQGFIVPFLGHEFAVQPSGRSITNLTGLHRPGFQTGLVLTLYLARAGGEGLAGRMVTGRELNGGALFFQGPHALCTAPVIERFGRDAAAMVRRAQAWGAVPLDAGDAAFRLFALPKVLVAYTLHEADDDFNADLTITFDAMTDRHLPLDAIWAMINILSNRLAEKDHE